jgi:hypothetical protein
MWAAATPLSMPEEYPDNLQKRGEETFTILRGKRRRSRAALSDFTVPMS